MFWIGCTVGCLVGASLGALIMALMNARNSAEPEIALPRLKDDGPGWLTPRVSDLEFVGSKLH